MKQKAPARKGRAVKSSRLNAEILKGGENVVECPNCGNVAQFTVIVTIHKVFTRKYDEDGDLAEEIPEKEGLSRLETWICSACGGLIPVKTSESVNNNPEAPRPVNNRRNQPLKDKKKTSNKERKHDRVGERPSEKQIKYLNDLAERLEISAKEREGFQGLSKKEVSDKLTAMYKECKRKGVEI